MAKFMLAVKKLEYEYREVERPNNQEAFAKCKRWYEARGWELLGISGHGKPIIVLKFRRMLLRQVAINQDAP